MPFQVSETHLRWLYLTALELAVNSSLPAIVLYSVMWQALESGYDVNDRDYQGCTLLLENVSTLHLYKISHTFVLLRFCGIWAALYKTLLLHQLHCAWNKNRWILSSNILSIAGECVFNIRWTLFACCFGVRMTFCDRNWQTKWSCASMLWLSLCSYGLDLCLNRKDHERGHNLMKYKCLVVTTWICVGTKRITNDGTI